MKILVTGASGRVGTAIIAALQAQYELVLLSGEEINSPHRKAYVFDLTDFAKLEEVVSTEKPDVVIHLAALLGPACDADPEMAHKVNVVITEQLAELTIEHGAQKFIFVSTAAVYHQTELKPTDEASNVQPQSEYGRSKLAAEQALEKLVGMSSVQFIVLRPFNIYGPAFNHSLVNKLIHSTAAQPVQLEGPETFYRDYIYIDDVVKAFQQVIATSFSQQYTVMNIASGVATSNKDLVAACEAYGITPHYMTHESRLDVSWADITKAKELINFDPQQNVIIKGEEV